MMHTLDVAWKSAQVLGGGRGYDAAGSRSWRACGGLAATMTQGPEVGEPAEV